MGKENETPEGTEPQKPEQQVTPAAPVVPPEKPQQAAPQAAPTNSREPRRARIGVEDDIPEDADLLELPRKALKERLNRHTATQLKDRFGTSNFDEIDAKIKKADEYERLEEERKRAAMTKEQQLEADLAKERELREDAVRRYNASVEDRVVDQQDSRIIGIAKNIVDEEYIDVLLPKLAKHLKKHYNDEELKSLKDDKIESWFKKVVEKKPKLGKDFGVTPPAAAAPTVVKKPHTNGARSDTKPNGKVSGTSQEKNFSPSAENAMSTSEAKAAAAAKGYRW